MNAAIDISSEIMRIMPEHVTPLWPQFEAIFVPALRLVSTHTPEDVRRAVLIGRAQLWAQMDGGTVEAAATTEFVDYPVGVFVRVWLAGCRSDRDFMYDGFYELMERWRENNRCVGFEAIGRHGWLRKFPRAKVEGLVMRWIP